MFSLVFRGVRHETGNCSGAVVGVRQPFTLKFVYTRFQVLDEASSPNEIRTTSGFHASFAVGRCYVVIMVMFAVR